MPSLFVSDHRSARLAVPTGRRQFCEPSARAFGWGIPLGDPYLVVPEEFPWARYFLREMRAGGGYTLPETWGVRVIPLQNRKGFHVTQAAGTRRV